MQGQSNDWHGGVMLWLCIKRQRELQRRQSRVGFCLVSQGQSIE